MTEIQIDKHIIYVTGLPRSGSTLMCQLLGHHPRVYSPGHSSPLSQLLDNIRALLSDNPFLLSQLDVDFDLAYARLLNAHRGFINGWFAETDRPVVVDKNRGWLRMIETVHLLDPDFRMVVCIRDLRQIFGSIEAQHAKTRLLDFPDHMAAHSAYARADALFGPDGVIGGPLKSIEFLRDVPDALRQRLCYVSFEALMEKPVETMNTIHRWLGLPAAPFDPNRLETRPGESDSHYRFKYRHQTRSAIRRPEPREIPPRIAQEIAQKFGWFFEQFYPGQQVQHAGENARPAESSTATSDEKSDPTSLKKGFLNKIGF